MLLLKTYSLGKSRKHVNKISLFHCIQKIGQGERDEGKMESVSEYQNKSN